MESASFSISEGMVAEKNKVCRRAGISFNTFLISCMKPISSIRSASSNTKYSNPFNEIQPCDCKSSKRPGVAINTCTPRFKASTCAFWGTPPKMTACFTPVYPAYWSKFSPICIASSRVGVSINALIPFLWSD